MPAPEAPDIPESMYPPRAGHGLDESFDTLSRAPEDPLPPEQVKQAIDLDELLTTGKGLAIDSEGNITADNVDGVNGLENIYERNIASNTFFCVYFLDPQGYAELKACFPDAPIFTTVEEAEEFMRRQNYADLDKDLHKKVKELAEKSTHYAERIALEAFKETGYTSLDTDKVPEKLVIVENPAKLLAAVRDLRRLKDFMRDVSERETSEANHIIIAIHRRRINLALAGLYSDVLALVRTHLPDDPRSGPLMYEIYDLMSGRLFKDNDDFGRRMSKLDMFINGGARMSPEAGFVPLGPEINDLLARLKQQYEEPSIEEEPVEPLISEADSEIRVNAEVLKSWYEEALAAYGLLSEHEYTREDLNRDGKAPDGKWQAVIHPSAKTLSVNSKQGIIRIPKRFNRKLYESEEVGGVPAIDHEMGHVFQSVLAAQLDIPILRKVGTGRIAPQLECGAIVWERAAALEFFGKQRPANPHYAEAIRTRLNGGSYGDCVKSFYDSMLRSNPKDDPYHKESIAIKALDRVRRLFRNGGKLHDTSSHVFDSGTLAYIEQDLILQEARKAGMEHFLLVGKVELHMLAELHRRAIIDISKFVFPDERPTQKIRGTILKYVEDSKRAQTTPPTSSN
jgi:hypothetical protein